MTSTLIKNIKSLVNTRSENKIIRGEALANLPSIEDAYLSIQNDRILGFGPMENLSEVEYSKYDQVIDAKGQFVLPTWCDSHTHVVFAGSREDEFVDKIKGLSYAEVAAKGGGILNSAKKLSSTDEQELIGQALVRIDELMKSGTGALEIKSGYGLTTAGELKMLRVIKQLQKISPIPIKSTFLAAHTYPHAFKENHQGYIDLIVNEMLPVIAEEQLADFIDVFCETGFFSTYEMEIICHAGMKFGLKPKLHINQLNSIGGLQKALALNALTVDHLETMNENDIKDLSNSNCIGTLLPTAAFFLRMPYQPARALIDNGCAIALASDFNPGSSPSGNMNFVIALSCIQMKMLPEEAINAATLNGAYAMELEREVGSISIGKKANLIFTKKIPSLAFIPYSFGSNLIDKVMIDGKIIA